MDYVTCYKFADKKYGVIMMQKSFIKEEEVSLRPQKWQLRNEVQC